MKTSKLNKNILKLATSNFESDLNQYKYMTEENRESYIKDNYKALTKIKNALLKGNYYTRVDSVSRSGMSRKIVIKIIIGGKLLGVDDFVYKLAGCNKNGSISGCGMDMLFAAQYNLFMAICPNHKYQDAMKGYNCL